MQVIHSSYGRTAFITNIVPSGNRIILCHRPSNKSKSAVSYISDFEKVLVEFARVRKCDGVICGHIHHPANTYYDGIHYLNSGDWVESLSALTEDADGNWNIMEYHHVLADENEDNKEFTLIHTAS